MLSKREEGLFAHKFDSTLISERLFDKWMNILYN